MTRESLSAPIRIWALLGARAGDNDQVIALAEALGLPFETKQLEYNGLHRLGPRLLGRSLMSLSTASRELILAEPPPDLTISGGHRSVAVVQALRHRSRRTRSIHVGFPRIPPRNFDLVIATPQYPIPDDPHLLRVPYALTRAATAAADPADAARIADLQAPRRLLIIGGPTLFWNLDTPVLLKVLARMLDEAGQDGGSVLVTTSPRTPAAVTEQVAAALNASDVPTLLAKPKQSPGYASLLGGADIIRITADSVAMISDAIWTGKPVGLVPIAKSSLGRLAFGVVDRIRPGRRLYPQDLRFFWRALKDAGVSERVGTPRTSTAEEMRMILERARAVLASADG